MDPDFKITRPTRYYRKGLHLLRPEPADREFHTAEPMHEVILETEVDCASAMDSITGKITRALNVFQRSTSNMDNVESQENGSPPRPTHARHDSTSSGSSVASNLSPCPMLDPSTHVRPLQISQPQRNGQVEEQNQQQDQTLSESEQRKRKKRSQGVSKHTFYIKNSQMRLKLFARNEVSTESSAWVTTNTALP